MTPEDQRQRAVTLLAEAQQVLSRYWFESTEDGDANNEDVIEIDKKITEFLAAVKDNGTGTP